MRAYLLPCLVILVTNGCLLVSQAVAISFDELLDSFDVLQTVAGTAQVTPGGVSGWMDSMEGQDATEVELSRPHMTMADWTGRLYIADKDAHAIRTVTVEGSIQTIVGTNQSGYNGDGPAEETELSFPNGLYTFPNGVTYILDLGNSAIRRLSLDGQVTTVVEDFQGLGAGRGLWVSPDESTIYYSAGTEVRRWTEDEGVTVYADGFVQLGNLTVDPSDGNVVATDRMGHAVYKLFEDGSQELIAGNGRNSGGVPGMLATQVGLDEVRGIHFHPEGGYLLATHDGGKIWFVDDDNRIYVLINGDDDGAHSGDGQPLSTPGRKISEPRSVVLGPNGDLIVTEHDGGYIRVAKALDPWQMGDFNLDRQMGVDDIDQLSDAVRAGRHLQTLDLTFDERLDEDDRQVWVKELRATWFGDANLDGEFNSADFVQVFARGKYEDADAEIAGWADGDWNGDGRFTSADLVTAFVDGGYEAGAVAARSVPEPTSLTWWIGFFCGSLLFIRR